MDQLLAALRGAGEATRLRILALLCEGELTVGELVQILDQSQPRVSRHLKLMGEAGLLDRFQEGTQVFYRLTREGVGGSLNQALSKLLASEAAMVSDMAKLGSIREERAQLAQAFFKANAKDWDKIRSLHVAETAVEAKLKELQGGHAIDRFLDIGTGTGRMLELFGPLSAEGLGIDVSRDMLAIARTTLTDADLGHCQVRLGDMYALEVPDNSQNLVVIHQVLHFADEPAKVIAETARVLKVSGQILIVDFAPHDQEFLREEQAHRRLGFADEELKTLAEANGLTCHPTTRIDGGRLSVNIWNFSK